MWEKLIQLSFFILHVFQILPIVEPSRDIEKMEKLLGKYHDELKDLKQKYYDMKTDLTKRVVKLEDKVKLQDSEIRILKNEGQNTKNQLDAAVTKLQAQDDVIQRIRDVCKERMTQSQHNNMETLVKGNTSRQDRDTGQLKVMTYNDTSAYEEDEDDIFDKRLGEVRSERLLSAVTSPSPVVNGHAFYAYMSKDLPPPSPHHTFIYDNVITNIGGNYNKHSGMFTVPDSGVYFFSATSITDANAVIFFEIVKNSAPLATGLANSLSIINYHTGTIMGIIEAEQGDVIHVRSQDPPPISDSVPSKGIVKSRSWARTSFCGWRIL